MKQVKRLSALTFGTILFLAGCSKKDAVPSAPVSPSTGLYVLDEGSFSLPNSTTLTYYDNATKNPVTDFYQHINDSILGSTGNDILVYGSKLYVVMNISSNITVIDKSSGKSIKRINAADGASWLPRYAVPYNGRLYVSAYDGTVSVIDTSTLSITQRYKVGTSPEGLTVTNNKVYVANSGGANYPAVDSTVSVIDLAQGKEVRRIKVGPNPQKVVADAKGNVYVLTWSVFDNSFKEIMPSKVYKIDAGTQKVTDSTSALSNSGKMAIYNDNLYLTGINNNAVVLLPAGNLGADFTVFITDGTTLTTPYGVDIDENNADVYLTDALDYSKPGKVFCFDKTGKLKFSFTAGVAPDRVVFLR